MCISMAWFIFFPFVFLLRINRIRKLSKDVTHLKGQDNWFYSFIQSVSNDQQKHDRRPQKGEFQSRKQNDLKVNVAFVYV